MKRILLAFSIAIAVLSSLFASLKSAALMRFRPHASFRPHDYGIRPHHVATLMSVVLLVGCSGMKTAGVYNADLQEKQPYVFSYDGSVQDATVSLRNALLPTGFSPVSQDEYEGGASFVYGKTLSDDEKFVTKGYVEEETGVSTGQQTGKLIFLLEEDSSGNVTVQMTSRLTATVKEETNAFKTSKQETESEVPQGHPLPMKYGRKLADMEGWTLESPSRAAVFKTEGEEQTAPDEETDPAQETEAEASSGEPAAPESPSPAASPADSAEASSGERSAPAAEERPGDGGDDVEWVQTTLNNLGHACGPEDGVMGPNTRSCIRSFQKANDLEVTGKINEATYQKMLEKR